MLSLSLNRISKCYRIPEEHSTAPGGLASKLAFWKQRRREFWALRDIDIEIQHGETVGIIGPNGAGKSTLLKLLAGITAPSAGEILIGGKISALLEVGSGFHPELTGYENIYLSGSILGMRRKEITEKIERIVEFAGVRKFIDLPIKRYSSGMVVRLGFSIAAHLEADILLLDEVLAVGDMAYQKKCLERILEMKHRATIVFISHDLAAVRQLCDRIIVLSGGQVQYDGEADGGIKAYNDLIRFRSSPRGVVDSGPRAAEVRSLEFLNRQGEPEHMVRTGEPLRIRVGFEARSRLPQSSLNVFFYGMDGNLCCQFSTLFSGDALDLDPGTGAIEFACEELGLQPGSYLIDTTIEQGPKTIEWLSRCSTLQVNPGKEVRGSFYHPHAWSLARDGGRR